MKDGGRAFPRAAGTGFGMEEGMTLRAYFVAHAPAQPWSWFKPKIVRQEPSFPDNETLFQGLTKEQIEVVWEWWRHPYYDLGKKFPEYQKVHEAMRQYRADRKAWEEEWLQQTDIQWPAFWAEQMLKNFEGK